MVHRNNLIFYSFCAAFWMLMCIGFVIEEILPFLEPLRPAVYLLGDTIILALGFYTLRTRKQWLAVMAFFLIAFVSSKLVNGEQWIEFFNGIRDYIGLLFACPVMSYLLASKDGERYKQSIDRQLKVFLWIQAFCILEQFIRYGANDHGGGTLGNGGSGLISMSVILVSFYLVTRSWDNSEYLKSLWKNRMWIILMFPVFLNETKVSFVMLALYFLLLYKPEIRSVGKFMIALPFIGLAFVALYFVYIHASDQSERSVADSDFIMAYLDSSESLDGSVDDLVDYAEDIWIEDLDHDFVDIPRFQKIGVLPWIMKRADGGLLLGAGVSQFKGGTVLGYTKFAEMQGWYLYGTSPWICAVSVELGFIGLAWFLWYAWYCIGFRRRTGPMSYQMKLMLIATVVLILFYNNAFRSQPFSVLFFSLCALTSVSAGKKESQGTKELPVAYE